MASLNREGVGGAQSHILEPRPCYLGGIILKRGGVDKVSRGMAPSCLIQLCLLPLEVPLRPLTKLPLADLSVAGHQERPDQGACRWPLEGPEASLSPTWTALAFSLVLLSPLWPPPVPLQPEATGKVPSPALASSPTVFSPPAVLHD